MRASSPRTCATRSSPRSRWARARTGSSPRSDTVSRPSEVIVREVGPRDGLQGEAPITVDDRVRLIDAVIAAGVTHVEACSFVSPKAVPAMAGAGDVLRALDPRPG